MWFREGVVEWLAADHATRDQVNRQQGDPNRMASDDGLRERSNRAAAYAGYREARAKVAELMAHYGEATVLGWVAQGLPEEVKNSIASTPATKSR